MTQERLRYLFERYIQDLLTAEEKREFMGNLNDADDEKNIEEVLQQLWQDSGEPDAPVDTAGEKRIQNVMNRVVRTSRLVAFKDFTKHNWLKIAAVSIITLSAGLWITGRYLKTDRTPVITKNSKITIHPGGNKAYLTMANGAKIVLNNVQNGNIAVQSGTQINKVKNGLLVYNSANSATAPTAETEYNTITTPRGGQYQVLLSDGTKAWLNAGSSIKFPVLFNGPERKVEITGEVYFEVAKNKALPFIVKASDVNIRVLGTHFNVSAYADDPAVTTTLMEGSVQLSKGQVTALLVPGKQGIAVHNKTNFLLQSADIEATEAWRKGLFIFHEETIANVMKIMARWYDVDIEYQGNIRNKEFGGSTSKSKDITTLLENMQLTGAIHYRIAGRRVIVMN